jgi:hypothetical protein
MGVGEEPVEARGEGEEVKSGDEEGVGEAIGVEDVDGVIKEGVGDTERLGKGFGLGLFCQ